MEKTYKLTIPENFDSVAKTAWKLMEGSQELYEQAGLLVVINDTDGFDDPIWEGPTYSELEAWLIRCFQEWVATGPVANPMWQSICESLK